VSGDVNLTINPDVFIDSSILLEVGLTKVIIIKPANTSIMVIALLPASSLTMHIIVLTKP
jgi:hypothetical protein